MIRRNFLQYATAAIASLTTGCNIPPWRNNNPKPPPQQAVSPAAAAVPTPDGYFYPATLTCNIKWLSRPFPELIAVPTYLVRRGVDLWTSPTPIVIRRGALSGQYEYRYQLDSLNRCAAVRLQHLSGADLVRRHMTTKQERLENDRRHKIC